MRLGRDDDLRLAIDRGHRRVALDHALGSGHLGAVVVRHIALSDRAFLGAALGVGCEELPDTSSFVPQALDARGIQRVCFA